MPNIHNILTNIAHRFGHQSGLHGSSEHKGRLFFKMVLRSASSIWCFQKWAYSSNITRKYVLFFNVAKTKTLRQACSAVNRAWGYQSIWLIAYWLPIDCLLTVGCLLIAYWLPIDCLLIAKHNLWLIAYWLPIDIPPHALRPPQS